MGATEKPQMLRSRDITAKLAEFVANLRFEDLPSDVIRLAKNSFLDTLGIALAGATEEAPKILTRFVMEMGGKTVASVVGQGCRTTSPQAALVNGTAADILGWSDISVIQMNHPSVSVCPAAWAVGEQLGSSGKDVLLAHIVGVEIANKIGAGVRPGLQLKGWHPLGVLNTFGCAAAAGKLLGLGAGGTANALGIAGAEASGMRVAMGTMSKAYGAGRSAHDGVVSAILASLGYTGPANVIEGRDGFLQTFGDGASGAGILENLGDPLKFTSPGITLKKFPACTRSHNGIQGVLDLRKQHGFTADDVESVECLVTPAVADYLKFPQPRSKFESKYSMEFCVATALLDGKVVMQSFSDEKVHDPSIAVLMKRVKMTIWPEYAKHGYNPPHAPYGCLVKIRLKDGREVSRQVDQGPWEPATPPSWDDLVEKYRSNAESVLAAGRIDQSIELVSKVENLDDIRPLMDIVRGKDRL